MAPADSSWAAMGAAGILPPQGRLGDGLADLHQTLNIQPIVPSQIEDHSVIGKTGLKKLGFEVPHPRKALFQTLGGPHDANVIPHNVHQAVTN